MSLHNYVVTDMKKVSTKNFQLFPHSFPQQNIDNVLFFFSFQHAILTLLYFHVEKSIVIWFT